MHQRHWVAKNAKKILSGFLLFLSFFSVKLFLLIGALSNIHSVMNIVYNVLTRMIPFSLRYREKTGPPNTSGRKPWEVLVGATMIQDARTRPLRVQIHMSCHLLSARLFVSQSECLTVSPTKRTHCLPLFQFRDYVDSCCL